MVPDGSPKGIPSGQMVAGNVNALTFNDLKQSGIWNNLEQTGTN
jgi:hypothetical protein